MYKMTNYINEEYKIKIYSTTQEELLLNGSPITIYIRDEINDALLPEYNDDIDEICILYKTIDYTNYTNYYNYTNYNNSNTFTKKSLEIFFNSCITEDEFISYIKYMHYVGFSSQQNYIEFINTQTNEIIYKYDFVNILPQEIDNVRRNVNKSVYTKSRIYIK